MRAFREAFLGKTKSLGGFGALAGSDFAVHVVGSGVVSVGVALAGFERVRAIAAMVSDIRINQVYCNIRVVCSVLFCSWC